MTIPIATWNELFIVKTDWESNWEWFDGLIEETGHDRGCRIPLAYYINKSSQIVYKMAAVTDPNNWGGEWVDHSRKYSTIVTQLSSSTRIETSAVYEYYIGSYRWAAA